ncbi:MAG: hypothetical protein WA718_11655, partial [Terriglobales bacterium]
MALQDAARRVLRRGNTRISLARLSGKSCFPQGLKPLSFGSDYGAAEAAPFQNDSGLLKPHPFKTILDMPRNLWDSALAVFE